MQRNLAKLCALQARYFIGLQSLPSSAMLSGDDGGCCSARRLEGVSGREARLKAQCFAAGGGGLPPP